LKPYRNALVASKVISGKFLAGRQNILHDFDQNPPPNSLTVGLALGFRPGI
jgi:hypothetical protein